MRSGRACPTCCAGIASTASRSCSRLEHNGERYEHVQVELDEAQWVALEGELRSRGARVRGGLA